MNGTKKIGIIFLIFILLFIANLLIGGSLATKRMWIILNGYCVMIAMGLLLKYKLPSAKKMIMPLGLSLLVALSYISNFTTNPFSIVLNPMIAFFCILAITSTFDHYPKYALPFIRVKRGQPLMTLFMGIVVGTWLGIINLMLARQPVDFNSSIYSLLGSLSPAIFEELVMRTLFYALCLHFFKGNLETKIQHLICLMMMIIPHVLIHTPNLFIQMGIVSGLVNTLIYVFLYGLPFAILQKRWDISSAMLAHGVVDFIRFCFVGLPV